MEDKKKSTDKLYVANNLSTGTFKLKYLALINRARGLYGRILTEVVSTDCTHDRGQDSLIQTDLARLIRC